MNIDERSTCRQNRSNQLLRQQLVTRSFDMSKEVEHVQFVSMCRKDEKMVRHVDKIVQTSFFDSNLLLVRSTCRKKLNMFNLFRCVERTKKSFDMLTKTATCRTATFDISKQRSTCCFDMLLVWTGLNV